MKRFGEPFEKYETFEIAHLSVPDTLESIESMSKVGVYNTNTDELTAHTLSSTRVLETQESAETHLHVVPHDYLTMDAKKRILNEVDIGAAKVATVYPISPEQEGLADSIRQNLPYFDYYVVELGLNVCIGREAKIPQLKFEADLYSDSDERNDVTTNSVSPTDEIRRVKIVDGKVAVGVSKLLELIPVVGDVASKLLTIDINPIEFKAELTKYSIDTSGPRSYNTSWRIYGTETVQSFNPVMILKARKNVNKIWAIVRVTYILQTGFFNKAEVESNPIVVKILPI
jgi:hypothetical protein